MDSPANPELEAALAKIREAEPLDLLGSPNDSVHCRGYFGDTPLHIAATWGDVELGRVLFDNGANPNAQGEDGCTPLHEAVAQGYHEFVKLLLDHGASLEVTTYAGTTARDVARLVGDAHMKLLFD